jgi:hypothetical protein
VAVTSGSRPVGVWYGVWPVVCPVVESEGTNEGFRGLDPCHPAAPSRGENPNPPHTQQHCAGGWDSGERWDDRDPKKMIEKNELSEALRR